MVLVTEGGGGCGSGNLLRQVLPVIAGSLLPSAGETVVIQETANLTELPDFLICWGNRVPFPSSKETMLVLRNSDGETRCGKFSPRRNWLLKPKNDSYGSSFLFHAHLRRLCSLFWLCIEHSEEAQIGLGPISTSNIGGMTGQAQKSLSYREYCA